MTLKKAVGSCLPSIVPQTSQGEEINKSFFSMTFWKDTPGSHNSVKQTFSRQKFLIDLNWKSVAD